jgi:hypothetical protein
MGYNPSSWWTKGINTKPLSSKVPVLLKIRKK